MSQEDVGDNGFLFLFLFFFLFKEECNWPASDKIINSQLKNHSLINGYKN